MANTVLFSTHHIPDILYISDKRFYYISYFKQDIGDD